MTKRSLYALLGLGLLVASAPRPAEAQVRTQPPCAACIAMTILPGQVLLLPDELHGLVVLIRVSHDRTQEVAAGIDAVRRRGGKPGLIIPPGESGSPEAVYRLKILLSDLRSGAAAAVRLAVADPSGELADPLAPYADVIVSPGPQAGGRRVWEGLGPVGVREALDRTTAGGREMWVLDVPLDVILAREAIRELVQAAAPPPDALVEAVEVSAAAPLTADEIVARHQAVARRQSAAVATVISTGTLTLTFEAPGFAAPVTIASETVIYQGAGRTELEQREIRINGIAFEGRGVPRLPIIEPERVSALPLTITLERSYRYTREGDESLRGIRCYVVAFEPAGAGPAFKGRAWITVDGFHLLRVAAAQTGLRGAIVSSEQTDDYAELASGAWLLVRSDVRQLYEGAGHRTPIHRLLAIAGAEVNPGDFDARLRAAYRSASIMLRDTAEGYRYLRRSTDEPSAAEPGAAREVVEARANRVRTLAAGVIVDPNISIPLPFAGINYVDFDLFGRGIQFNGFFGGSYGQMAVAIPSLGGSRWQLGGRAFGIASSYNDRSFRDGREIYDENVRQRPAHGSVWLLRPFTPRLALRAGYELDYTALSRAPETAPGFVAPADQVVHGLRLAVEGQRDGWAGTAWWNPARRAGWRPWGRGEEDYDPGHHDFQRFGVTVGRATAFGPAFVTRLEGAAMGGTGLDRFSRYTFGTFDNRLRGYPAALVRYDRGAVLRAAFAWSASRVSRVDGFLDTALVRDRGYGRRYRNYTGAGIAVEAPLPFGILGAVEWGFGFRGVNSDGSLGTHVIRVSALKIF